MAKSKSSKTQEGLKASAHKIWLAGLGALAMAEEEGEKLFRSLVERGERYEHGLKSPVERASGQVKEKVEDVRSRAGETVSKVEAAFDAQVSEILNKLGLPMKGEIAELSSRVERLTKALDEIKTSPKAARKPSKKKTTKKSTPTRTAKRASKTSG